MAEELKEIKGRTPDWLRNLKNKNRIVHGCWEVYKFITIKPKLIPISRGMKKRRNGFEEERFMPLKNLKGKYKGKRCFIIATGPSLTLSDVEMLEGEYTFGMNSLALIYEKTKWRPTFYGAQDPLIFHKFADAVNQNEKSQVFVSNLIADKFEMKKDWIQFPFNSAYHVFESYNNKYFAKFSDDCYEIVYDGFSIAYSLIQIAAYLGFEEMYLLGVDCNYKKNEKNHFVEYGLYNKNEYLNGQDRLLAGFKEAKKFADRTGIKIYNATRGGMLEVFERVNLDEVVAKK